MNVSLACVTTGALIFAGFLLDPRARAQEVDPPPDDDPDEASLDTGATDEPPSEAPDVTPTRDDDPDDDVDDDDADDDDEQRDPAAEFLSGFHFGSYGRIVGASDLAGHTGRQSRVVTFAPRIDEDDTYAEIELRREDRFMGVSTRVVATVAYAGPLFHYDGEFGERIAIRNLFAEANDILLAGLSIWGGSRMVRGDDVYLMNFWPLDNLNTIGGGLRYAFDDYVELAVTVGMSQPNNPFQRQTDLAPARVGFLPDEIFILDRPRVVLAARATAWPLGRYVPDGIKGLLYFEQHYLGAGERRLPDGLTTEALPEDSGFVLGAQIGGYLTAQRTFANLFFRYARGLASYDPLGVPFRTGTPVSTGRAEEIRLALSANWEWNESPDVGIGVQVGAWWRLFRDADPAVFNRGALSEGALSVRPMVFLGQFAGVMLDVSYQAMQTAALDERTGDPEGGGVFKLGLAPFVTPLGRGTYTRPHIRLLYVLTARDTGAQRLYSDLDARSRNQLEHFLGVSVEWWFSSSSYGQ